MKYTSFELSSGHERARWPRSTNSLLTQQKKANALVTSAASWGLTATSCSTYPICTLIWRICIAPVSVYMCVHGFVCVCVVHNLSTITYLQNEMEFMPMPPIGCQWQLQLPAELGLTLPQNTHTTYVHSYDWFPPGERRREMQRMSTAEMSSAVRGLYRHIHVCM